MRALRKTQTRNETSMVRRFERPFVTPCCKPALRYNRDPLTILNAAHSS